jgi:hypothetical protein
MCTEGVSSCAGEPAKCVCDCCIERAGSTQLDRRGYLSREYPETVRITSKNNGSVATGFFGTKGFLIAPSLLFDGGNGAGVRPTTIVH